jgi:hypothetical protein
VPCALAANGGGGEAIRWGNGIPFSSIPVYQAFLNADPSLLYEEFAKGKSL